MDITGLLIAIVIFDLCYPVRVQLIQVGLLTESKLFLQWYAQDELRSLTAKMKVAVL